MDNTIFAMDKEMKATERRKVIDLFRLIVYAMTMKVHHSFLRFIYLPRFPACFCFCEKEWAILSISRDCSNFRCSFRKGNVTLLSFESIHFEVVIAWSSSSKICFWESKSIFFGRSISPIGKYLYKRMAIIIFTRNVIHEAFSLESGSFLNRQPRDKSDNILVWHCAWWW